MAILENWDTSPVTEDEKRRLEAFEDEIIDRLFVLNGERAEQERVLGLGGFRFQEQEGEGGVQVEERRHEGQKGLFG
jgi:hypothetical protein